MLFSHLTSHTVSQYGVAYLITNFQRYLLNRTELTFDRPEYYMKCARARTYTEHTAPKCARARTYTEHTAPNFVLEHTKPLFNENGFLSLRNLYKYFTLL